MKPPNVVPDAVIDSIAQSHVKFLRQGECPLHDGTWRGLSISLADSLEHVAIPCTCAVSSQRFEHILRELKWNGDHYYFYFAGMYVGVELDGYMHT